MKHQTLLNSPLTRLLNHALLLPALLALTIFLLPSNWFLKLDPTAGYVHGLQVDYLIPKLYASILSAGVFAAVWSWQQHSLLKRQFHKLLTEVQIVFSFIALSMRGAKVAQVITSPFVLKNVALLSLLALVAARQLFTAEPASSTWFLLQLLAVLWFGIAVYHQRKLLEHKFVLNALTTTVVFQTLLGGYQFFTQQSLVGYWLLGENNLSQTYGLAREVFGGAELVLAYGTTPHPNVLAGVVIAYLWILWIAWRTSDKTTSWRQSHVLGRALISTSGLGVLYITQSLSAVALAVSGGLLILLAKSKLNEIAINRFLLIAAIGSILILPILLVAAAQFTENLSISRRMTLNSAALSMMTDTPVIGVGINNFTAQLENYAGSEVVRFVQPAHHVGLLVLAELGVAGGALFVLFSRLVSLRALARALFLLAIPLSLDHYLYTLPQGQLLGILVLAASALTTSSKERKSPSA